MKKLSWSIPSGKMGGCESWEINFEDMTIEHSHTGVHNLDINMAETAQWVIEENVKQLQESINQIDEKLNVKETKHEPIQDGYRIIEPPTEKMKQILLNKKEEKEKELNELLNLDILVSLRNKKNNKGDILLEKLNNLKKDWKSLDKEYKLIYHLDSVNIQKQVLLDKMKAIEQIFRMLGMNVHDNNLIIK